MNLFALDMSPAIAAHYQSDKHVVKMILETMIYKINYILYTWKNALFVVLNIKL